MNTKHLPTIQVPTFLKSEIEVTNPKIGHDVHRQPNRFANMSDEEIRQWLAYGTCVMVTLYDR